jgi:hypothetical protein
MEKLKKARKINGAARTAGSLVRARFNSEDVS